MPEITLRKANREDSLIILNFIKALADYEKLSDAVSATPEQLEKTLFDQNAAKVILAEVDGQPAGFALYFNNYSTFLAKPGLYLEDLYVYPEYRKSGVGKALFNALKEQAKAEGCGRMEWSVLDWNKDAWVFYEAQGAIAMEEWTVHRIEF
jgi:GNAT superfamily N-acetyltransferase